MAGLIVGALCILIALMPNPSYYFGEHLFGVRLVPYWVWNSFLIGLGAYSIVNGLWPHD